MNSCEVFDYLDSLSRKPAIDNVIDVLSSSERIYVALAANRPDLLPKGDTIAYSIWRLGPDWVNELAERHRCD